MPVNLQLLADEIKNDPIARGYAQMGDEEIAKTFTIVDRIANRESVTSAQILTAIVRSEYAALENQTDRDYLQLLLTVPSVPLNTLIKSELMSIFDSGKETRNNLAALLTREGTRADELGLGGFVTPSDVAVARKLGK